VSRPNFSIKSLLLLIGFFAVSCASLKGNWYFWPDVVTTLTMLTLTAAGFVGWYSDGNRRAFYCSFAIVGWCYFLLMNLPIFASLKEHLLIRFPLDFIKELVRPDVYNRDPSGNIQNATYVFDYYDQIARCIETVILAAILGCFGARLSETRASRRSPVSPAAKIS
jgi:hypothetical protein